MADYWKSQARKFCDFCKCWISDNKASVDFHENGKKHKENVAKRLKEIHKNSAKQAKQQKKFDSDLEKMEKAAMEAYMKDVANNASDMTSDSMVQQKWTIEQLEQAKTKNPNQIPEASPKANPRTKKQYTPYESYTAADVDPLDPYAQQKIARIEAKEKAKIKKQAKMEKEKEESEKKEKETAYKEASRSQLMQKKIWYEVRPQGSPYSYYWNTETNETVWEPPLSGYMSLAEQAEEAKEQALQEELLQQIDNEEKDEKAIALEEQRANAAREQLKEIRKRFHESKSSETTEEDVPNEEETVPYRRDYSVPDKPQPYGTWQVVEKPRMVNLQLPKKEEITPLSSEVVEPPAKRVFVEKTITSISTGDSDDEGSAVSFKKRKFGNRSVRKRMEDD